MINHRSKQFFRSDKFVVIEGLIIIPLLSFIVIQLSPESPLYTSISRLAWVHDLWVVTCIWAIIVMSLMLRLTYQLVCSGSLSTKAKEGMLTWLIVSIVLVFVGCIIFPAKQNPENILFINYLHDYLTAVAWVSYVAGLIVYSILLRKQDRFLGFLGLGLMSYIVLSSLFFLSCVVDPQSYVGASAVSEVCIINNLLIYLVVMYFAQKNSGGKRCCEKIPEDDGSQ